MKKITMKIISFFKQKWTSYINYRKSTVNVWKARKKFKSSRKDS